MLYCKPMSTPLFTGTKLLPDSGTQFSDPYFYRSLVGGLQYLTLTRPDLSYAVNFFFFFMHRPTVDHFYAVKRIFRYVKGTLDHGRPAQPLNLYGYSDADWAGCPFDRRSTTGYCIFLGPNVVSWCAKKLPTVSRSSAEAEYRSLASAAAEVTWLQFLLRDLGVYISQPTTLLCDNISATYMAHNPVFHARTKHIEIDYHFVREKVASRALRVIYVSFQSQLADIFTKALAKDRFHWLRSKLTVAKHRHST